MPRALRVTEQQRDRAVGFLGTAYRDGMLSTGTFELRVEAALRVRTRQQLRSLLDDLPRLRTWTATGLAPRRTLIARAQAPTAGAVNLVLPEGGVGSRLLIGRDPHCDVVFTDPTISRRHALLRREAAGWVLRDMGSSNGTWLNGRRVQRHPIAPGDAVTFGRLTATVI